MALDPGQVSLTRHDGGSLVMGEGTPYKVLSDFDPFSIHVRSPASGERAWGHGGWSGADWGSAKSVPLTVVPDGGPANGVTGWLPLHQALASVMRPVGDSGEDVELRFHRGGREYLMFVRPRMVEPDGTLIGSGKSFTRLGLVADDPLIYSAVPVEFSMGLPTFEGGLTVPFTVPFTVPGVQVGGRVDLENEGSAEVGMLLRIDGPVLRPRVALARSDGEVQTLRLLFDVAAGQWVEVDTAARTVQVNGLPQASRRGQVAGEFPLLPSGESTLRFGASEFHPAAGLSGSFRHGWW